MLNASLEIGTIVTGKLAPVNNQYVGRFAPSPTGPLHFGSLVAAAASYLQARANGGKWLVRIEDIDPPRAEAGAADSILRTLEAYGFDWDTHASFQSQSRDQHDAAIQRLLDHGSAYPCGCSRKDLQNLPCSRLGPIYPGTCRDGTAATMVALRVRTDNQAIVFDDLIQGRQEHRLESESGDFVILRKDNLIAYQLAVVVDDYLQGITEIVRGIDLMDSTPRQIWLQKLLGYPTPAYGHIPVAVDHRGRKLSKSQGAAAISSNSPGAILFSAFEFLEQQPPAALQGATVEDLWAWAIERWDMQRLRGITQHSVGNNLDQPAKFGVGKNP